MEDGFNVALGSRLRAARRRLGWSLTDVEHHTGQEFKASVLGAYERGERALSVHRLYRLAQIYDIPIYHLVPTALAEEQATSAFDLEQLAEGKGAEVVERFLSSIQLMRDPEPSEMAVRRSDLTILSSMLESMADVPAG
ncbi:MAG: helix-turn-helix transcriptional regulator [Acidimicrobiia bacterium]